MPAPSLSDRIRGCLWGQLIGDALCLGSHWIYNLGEMEQRFPGGLKGFESPYEGHYHFPKQPGEFTHYGDNAMLTLETVAQHGKFDRADFWLRYLEHFGSPEYTGYLDKATIATLENFAVFEDENPEEPYHAQGGADDDQLSASVALAPIVVAHREDPSLLEIVEEFTRVTQNNDKTVAYVKAIAIVLRDILNGKDFHGSFDRARLMAQGLDPQFGYEVRRKIEAGMSSTLEFELRQGLDEKMGSITDQAVLAVQKLGQSCPLPQSFPAATMCAAKLAHSFPDALLGNARAGGDNAGRGALIGAWLGALHGYEAIPIAWTVKLKAAPRIQVLVEKIVARSVRMAAVA